MRERFEMELEELHKEITIMGMLCETAIGKATQSLLPGSRDAAGELPDLLRRIKQHERDIELICLRLLLRQQPVAKDLRRVSAALKLVTDLGRIGDQSADLAEIASMGHIKDIPKTVPIHEMAGAVIKMVTESIDSCVKQDGKTANEVIEYDDVVDGLFNDCKTGLIAWIRELDADSEAIVDLLMIAKYLERIGDHAVNIARWALFSITGTI